MSRIRRTMSVHLGQSGLCGCVDRLHSCRRPIRTNENPDRYAAAICIRVRPDCCADIRMRPVRVAKVTDLRRYPASERFSPNGYFFFFLAVFFFAFFAFLAMLPSVIPKLVQCKSTFDTHAFRLHHNCKIDTPRFEEGKRPSRRQPSRRHDRGEGARPRVGAQAAPLATLVRNENAGDRAPAFWSSG